MFQGLKNLRDLNWEPFPVEPRSIGAVVLTHAHLLDHSGYLPKLVADGFRGPIYATPSTRAVAELILRDSGRLREKDAEHANRKGFAKHKPAKPLYGVKEGFYDIVVEDNGPGIKDENRNRLFTPNFTTKSSGTGLGLAICRNILERCGGEISYSRSFSIQGPASR